MQYALYTLVLNIAAMFLGHVMTQIPCKLHKALASQCYLPDSPTILKLKALRPINQETVRSGIDLFSMQCYLVV